jgi:uncharacterized repeat protein (TIGR01451 family)
VEAARVKKSGLPVAGIDVGELPIDTGVDDAPFLRPKQRMKVRRARRGPLARAVILLRLAAVLLVTLGTLFFAYAKTMGSERLKVGKLVVQGSGFLSEGEVRELLGPALGENILTLDDANFQQAIQSNTPVLVDLALTKDDGLTAISPGQLVTYLVTITNNGPNDVAGATVTDTFPATLTGVSWTCSASARPDSRAARRAIVDAVGAKVRQHCHVHHHIQNAQPQNGKGPHRRRQLRPRRLRQARQRQRTSNPPREPRRVTGPGSAATTPLETATGRAPLSNGTSTPSRTSAGKRRFPASRPPAR